ncbi:hypothetical protein [Facklamia miroungae]|uniref:Uncharacterized protein n=1 Tax=Facklamia miroungae TaxID=120956 RepID=A0A1G7T6Z1_9LACT|nr:hypothetical protein [Facklamia miroungae]NKZ29691.1 hypothetical protein [Facklamia miroungae]SDG31056.1 hypothetical protein SAMN05421791_10519 [Facklamia miroungae]
MTLQFGQTFLLPGRSLLQKEIDRLRIDLTQAVFEYDELLYKDCRYLENQFYFNVGKEWLNLLQKHYQSISLEKKYQIMRAYIGKEKDHRLREVDKDLGAYHRLILEIEEKIKAADDWGYEEELSEEELRSMRGIYREIITLAHPLLYPMQSKAREALYQKALTAYKRDDFEILQLILENLNEDYAQNTSLKLSQLVELRKNLLIALYETRYQLALKRSAFPYLIHDNILKDTLSEKMRQGFIQRQKQLHDKIKHLEYQIAKFKET